MVKEPVPVEDDGLDAGGLRPFGDHLADDGGRGDLVLLGRGVVEILAERGNRCDGPTGGVVNDLCVDMLCAPENGKTGTLGGPGQLLSDSEFSFRDLIDSMADAASLIIPTILFSLLMRSPKYVSSICI